jgi:hypothetical protein
LPPKTLHHTFSSPNPEKKKRKEEEKKQNRNGLNSRIEMRRPWLKKKNKRNKKKRTPLPMLSIRTLLIIALGKRVGTSTALATTEIQLDSWLWRACSGNWTRGARLSLPVCKLGILGRLFGQLLDRGFL